VHADEGDGPQRGLTKALAEVKRLQEENERLKKLLEVRASVPGIIPVLNILSPTSVFCKILNPGQNYIVSAPFSWTG
jgi:hypothetical protein